MMEKNQSEDDFIKALEAFFIKGANEYSGRSADTDVSQAFIAGVKWQKYKQYSKWDILNILDIIRYNYYDNGDLWEKKTSIALFLPENEKICFTSEEIIENYTNDRYPSRKKDESFI